MTTPQVTSGQQAVVGPSLIGIPLVLWVHTEGGPMGSVFGLRPRSTKPHYDRA